MNLRLANISNGLAFPHDDVCYFQSNFAHHCKSHGYFRIDAMPYRAIIHLLLGGTVTIIDGTRRHKPLSDALRFGVPTWCIVFNRGLAFRGSRHILVCDWQTDAMATTALSDRHTPAAHAIRKLSHIYGYTEPAIVGKNVLLECHHGCEWDDHPDRLRSRILETST